MVIWMSTGRASVGGPLLQGVDGRWVHAVLGQSSCLLPPGQRNLPLVHGLDEELDVVMKLLKKHYEIKNRAGWEVALMK